MKGLVVLSVLVSFAMICACQKQDSAAEAEIVQRKAELDTREKALDEREKALVEKEKMIARFRAIPSDLQARKPAVDPEQAKAEREKRIQQLAPELRALIAPPDATRVKAERDSMIQEQLSRRQRRLEELQRTGPQVQNQNAMSGATAAPPPVYPEPEATSPSSSPTPQ